VLFWSVIAAAFIGPGTVTTAASAGARYDHALLWALVFSTAACLLLQEAAARLTVASGANLGQALRRQYTGAASGPIVLFVVLGAIVLGCAAYEAGNIIGGVAGAVLGSGGSRTFLTLLCAAAAAVVLWFGKPQTVARLLGLLVAVMGVAFVVSAWHLAPSLAEIASGVRPTLPTGSGLLVIGLIGTTVVPYNLFLGSELARGQKLAELRLGLGVAVVLGGLISMAILVVGTAVDGPFSLEALAEVLGRRIGRGSRGLFALGLFAAGFSSAVTAPLAAAITARSLFRRRGDESWSDRSWRFRGVWLGVLLSGVVFGLTGVRPVPAIVAAQALNGVLLPLVAIFLLLAVNDRRLMGDERLNGPFLNVATGAVVLVTIVLGVSNLGRASTTVIGAEPTGERTLLVVSTLVALAVTGPLLVRLRRLRSR